MTDLTSRFQHRVHPLIKEADSLVRSICPPCEDVMAKEIWVPIHGCENKYHISNFGRIKSINYMRTKKERILKHHLVKGYPRLSIWINRKRIKATIHNLVLENFIGPRPYGYFGCHNDGNPSNNHLLNLRWDAPKENCKDRIKHKTHRCGENINTAKLNANDISKIVELKRKGMTYYQIAKLYNIHENNVYKIVKGIIWKHLLIKKPKIHGEPIWVEKHEIKLEGE